MEDCGVASLDCVFSIGQRMSPSGGAFRFEGTIYTAAFRQLALTFAQPPDQDPRMLDLLMVRSGSMEKTCCYRLSVLVAWCSSYDGVDMWDSRAAVVAYVVLASPFLMVGTGVFTLCDGPCRLHLRVRRRRSCLTALLEGP